MQANLERLAPTLFISRRHPLSCSRRPIFNAPCGDIPIICEKAHKVGCQFNKDLDALEVVADSIVHNIERKRAEGEPARLNGTLRTLYQCNESRTVPARGSVF
jgi:hypothetical protein